jgi:hypothetical protein
MDFVSDALFESTRCESSPSSMLIAVSVRRWFPTARRLASESSKP